LDKKVNFKAQYFDKQASIKSLNISKNAVKCLIMIDFIAFFAKICVDAKKLDLYPFRIIIDNLDN